MAEEKLISKIELIMIGGSSGSLDAILKILAKLNSSFQIPFIIIIHRNVKSDHGLAQVLSARTGLLVKEAEEKEPISKGFIYLAPADYHLLIETDHTLSLDVSEKVNYSRPSIDVTFQSAADVYREKLLCIVLSGANSDGSEGVAYAKELGSKIIIQDPQEAFISFMPEQAIAATSIDAVLNTTDIAAYLNEL